MADKDFKVKNKLFINGLTHNSGVLLAENKGIDSHTNLATQYGGTGTTTSPNAGQILYSSSGSTYAPTALSSLDVKGATYSADAPASPFVGQIWVESDLDVTSLDSNIIRRHTFTATAGQTNFIASINFIDGYEQVYFNGLLLLKDVDYTTSGNNTVVLGAAASENDIIEILTVTNLSANDTYTTSEIDSKILIAVPSQSGNDGKYLITNGTTTSWATVDLNNLEVAQIMGAY